MTSVVSGTGTGLISSTNGTADSANLSISAIRILVAFDSLSIVALLFLPIIILTAVFSSNVARTSTWFLIIGSMLIVSITNVLLLGEQTGPPPNIGLCMLQAVLAYAYPILVSFAGLSFMLQVYFSIHLALKFGSKMSRASEMWLHITPFAFFFALLVEALIVGLLDTSRVRRDPSGAYCSFLGPIPFLKGVLVIVSILGVFALEGLTIIKIRRASHKYASFQPAQHVSVDAVVRACVFNFCAMVVMMVSLIQSFSYNSLELNYVSVLAKCVVPFCAVVIFGTQKDLLRIWMFWRRGKPCANMYESVGITP